MRRWATLALAMAACAVPALARAASAEGQDAAARAYILVDDKTGHVLAGGHTNDKLQVASLTKVAMAVVVLDWVRLAGHTLDEAVSIPASALAENGNNPVSFQPGDEVSVRDLLYAALLQSDNVAADALAEFVGRDLLNTAPGETGGGGSRRGSAPAATVRFVVEMNALARHLHMERTRFYNPSGQDSTDRPYSTAADLARLTRFALAKADFRFFIAQKERRISIKRAGQPGDYLLRNTNELLGTKRVDGVKTGTTSRAGQCVILTAARDPIVVQEGTTSHITPRRLIVVLLGSPDRFREGAALLERGIGLYDQWAAAGYPEDPKQTL